MKKYFTEEFENAQYDFIQDSDFPEIELVTCVFALLFYKKKIFLTKNFRGWELPGGHVEKGETLDQALVREMMEEVGTGVMYKRLFGYKKFTNQAQIANRNGGFYPFPHSYILFYIGKATGEDIKIDCPDTLDYGLFPIEEALEKIDSESTKKILTIMKDFI